MSRKKYTADFETTSDRWVTKLNKKTGLEEKVPLNARVWLFGIMEIDDPEEKLTWGLNIDDFMNHIEKNKGDYYFHNLKFDGNFVVSWLLKNGFNYSTKNKSMTFKSVISKDRAWYKIDIIYKRHKDRHLDKVTIYDSLKKLPFSVATIGEQFDLGVEKIKWGQEDYNKLRPVGYIPDENELEYLEHDVKVMARALKSQFKTGLEKMTVASDAMASFKDSIGKKKFDYYFPQLPLSVDTDIRSAYFGGFTWCNPEFQNQEIGEGIVFDVRSLYPSMMYFNWLPVGDPVFFQGKYEKDKMYPLFIQKFICRFKLKENKIPTVQLSGGTNKYTMAEYAKNDGGEPQTLTMTSVDMKLFFDHYDVEVEEWLSGYKFTAVKGLFNQYINKWITMKNQYKGAIRQLAKLMLNSLYGKFGSNPDITKKIPYLDENGALQLQDDELELGKTSYVPMAAFITAYARNYTIRTATACIDRICYCDTDSIHLKGTEIPEAIKDIVDFGDTEYPSENKYGLGYWVHESTFKRAKFIRPKRYIEELLPEKNYIKYVGGVNIKPIKPKSKINRPKLNIEYIFKPYNGNLNIKCAGIQEKITSKMRWNDFRIGFVTHERLIPMSVNGGAVLINGLFEIKS